MPDLVPLPPDYATWLTELKTRIHSAQQRATLVVNRELVLLYWHIGQNILQRQSRARTMLTIHIERRLLEREGHGACGFGQQQY